jgi:carbohydrate kinase (thermoresistant glucokinase family)
MVEQGGAADGGGPSPPLVVVVMGVSGSGKTTVGAMLAGRLGWPFAEGDEFHSAANVAKMRSGVPLTDDDRWPWLAAIAGRIDAWRREGRAGVVACSALKRRYREILVGGRPDVRIVYLQGSRALIGDRLAARQGHYMPSALLDSQFAALEEPDPAERPITVAVGQPPEAIVDEIVAALGRQEGRG